MLKVSELLYRESRAQDRSWSGMRSFLMVRPHRKIIAGSVDAPCSTLDVVDSPSTDEGAVLTALITSKYIGRNAARRIDPNVYDHAVLILPY